MKKLLVLAALLLATPALAQNPQCPNRPSGDSTNACANTRFVQDAVSGGGSSNLVVGTTPVTGASPGQYLYNNAGTLGALTPPDNVTVGTTTVTGGVNGQFLYNNGGVVGTQAAPSSSLAVGTTPITGGTSGRILYDNAGTVGERVTSGNGTTIATTTGTLTNGRCVQIDANGNLVEASAACNSGSGAGIQVIDVTAAPYNAVGDCSTNNTTAFQNAWNAAKAAGGQGIVYIPPVPSGGCYIVGALNLTATNGVTMMGNGDRSLIRVGGNDGAGNWWDLSNSTNLTFQSFKVDDSGLALPAILFAYGSTGGVNFGILFDRVNVDARATRALFFGNGYNGIKFRDGRWYQRYNGASQTVPSRRTSVLRFDAGNITPGMVMTSANLTLVPTNVAWNTTLDNFWAVDWPAGFGGGSQDNNASVICVTCGQMLTITNGSNIRCVCHTAFVGWNFVENILFNGMSFLSSTDDVTVGIFAWFGGDSASEVTSGDVTFQNVFFSVPKAGGLFVAGTYYNSGQSTMFSKLKLITTNIGGTSGGNFLIGYIPISGTTCDVGGATANPWITESFIDAFGQDILLCGNMDYDSIITTAGTISTVPGVTRTGCKFSKTAAMSC